MTAPNQGDKNIFGSRATLTGATQSVTYYQLRSLEKQGIQDIARLPYTIKVLIENVLRSAHSSDVVSEADILGLARWQPGQARQSEAEYPFFPARVLLPDLSGIPAVADLAAMRSAIVRFNGDPNKVNPLIPADFVIDHSVQVDQFGSAQALVHNSEREYERNSERYAFLRWAQQAFDNFRVVPPGMGILHQVNLEYLASVVTTRQINGKPVAFPDTLVGADSHTPMVNSLGVLGWGVGGIEAEAVMLGQPLYLLMPEVIGIRLVGTLPEGTTATDIVLTVTQLLRQQSVVGKFIEFTGPGIKQLSLPDRATISNMSPEYGATSTIFPVDAETLRYLLISGRSPEQVDLVERYTKEQGMFRTDETQEPLFDDVLELDLDTIEPSVAGPRRPQDRVALHAVSTIFRSAFADHFPGTNSTSELPKEVSIQVDGTQAYLHDGSIAIAAITSCTNTSNPSVMIAAGLLAKHAVERGLTVNPSIKTSLAPGSRVVRDYLVKANLLHYLEDLRFHVVGFGCTTCIAEGTPVLLADGTARRIEQMPVLGGSKLLAPTVDGKLGVAMQKEMMVQGERECISLVLQDGRTLVCTPDHEILCTDGRWVRADQLVLDQDRVVIGLEASLDERGDDEIGYSLQIGDLVFTMDTPYERQRTLAFARLLGHLLNNTSISLLDQGRMFVEQVMDHQAILNDIEVLTGCRPVATRYDERKWSIVLPTPFTNAISTLEGIRTGWCIQQAPNLPSFLLDEKCPRAVVREFLGGLFGADGHAPHLHHSERGVDEVTLEAIAYSQITIPEQAKSLKNLMRDLIRLLARCEVKTDGASIYEYPTCDSKSSYQPVQDGLPRTEVRLTLPDGLSFVERVGFRYCVEKALRASAAAVYWRLVERIHRKRLMSSRIEILHQEERELSFARAQRTASVELIEHESVIFPHYSLSEEHNHFSRLPKPSMREFQPLDRDACNFPSPIKLFNEIGAREWFTPLELCTNAENAKRFCVEKDALTLPTLALKVVERRPAGKQVVFDLAVDDLHAFVAGTVAVHNCIGNSGPLSKPVAEAVQDNDLVVAAVLSGNRNFEGRIHPQVRASFLASPPLVVAYALAGTVDINLTEDSLGNDTEGNPVYLRDLWPTQEEIQNIERQVIAADVFQKGYATVFDGDERWQQLAATSGKLFSWNPQSTYIQEPPFFQGITIKPTPLKPIHEARVLVMLDDSVTTDHISPAGNFSVESPAGQYLLEKGVSKRDFNTYGARRSNHEIMIRGTFGNIRLRNRLTPGKEGYYTLYLPDGDLMTIYEAAQCYAQTETPLLVIAGKEYGTGSSRDWAAKGSALLGIRAVIAESFERIHRSNLVGMGILPLQFKANVSKETLKLTGHEMYTIEGAVNGIKPRQDISVKAVREDGSVVEFQTTACLNSLVEVSYYENGGILPAVLRKLLTEG